MKAGLEHLKPAPEQPRSPSDLLQHPESQSSIAGMSGSVPPRSWVSTAAHAAGSAAVQQRRQCAPRPVSAALSCRAALSAQPQSVLQLSLQA